MYEPVDGAILLNNDNFESDFLFDKFLDTSFH